MPKKSSFEIQWNKKEFVKTIEAGHQNHLKTATVNCPHCGFASIPGSQKYNCPACKREVTIYYK